MKNPYEDLLHLPHPTSLRHPRMSMTARAAQFAPYAALTGYGELVDETARQTQSRIELDELALAALDRTLRALAARANKKPQAAITYFEPDARKAGGAYRFVTGCVAQVDEVRRRVRMADGTIIPIDEIIEIETAQDE